LYVDLKLLVNCFVSSSQLPIVPFSNLLNHDLAAPVRCNYRLCIAVSFVPPNILTACKQGRIQDLSIGGARQNYINKSLKCHKSISGFLGSRSYVVLSTLACFRISTNDSTLQWNGY
jgi:hypothetical protein